MNQERHSFFRRALAALCAPLAMVGAVKAPARGKDSQGGILVPEHLARTLEDDLRRNGCHPYVMTTRDGRTVRTCLPPYQRKCDGCVNEGWYTTTCPSDP